ncbi:MAPKKK3 [Symbiodinium natans]|uniref:MAPKKK3 protein n=1 Tax=Symbiodinium natans TaxID=878477 RepID=A0A812NBE4_9DINO|nr:MAPKKK3 [Symbiodinium natans]
MPSTPPIKSWRCGSTIGQGSYGTVCRALEMESGFIFCVKKSVVTEDDEEGQRYIQKLREELDILRSLRHQNIICCLGHEYRSDTLYIFMEFAEGGSLATMLKEFGPLDGPTAAVPGSQELATVLLGLTTTFMSAPESPSTPRLFSAGARGKRCWKKMFDIRHRGTLAFSRLQTFFLRPCLSESLITTNVSTAAEDGVYLSLCSGGDSCDDRTSRMILLFTVAQFGWGLSVTFMGFVIDSRGPRFACAVGGLLESGGLLLLGSAQGSSESVFDGFLAGVLMVSVGGGAIQVQSMKLPFLVSAQLFPLVMTIANCLDDASASVPLGHYQLYLNGFSRFWIFTGYSGLCLALSAVLGLSWWGRPNRRLSAISAAEHQESDSKEGPRPRLHGLPLLQQIATFEFAFVMLRSVEFFRSNMYVGLNKEWLRSLGDGETHNTYLKIFTASLPLAMVFVPLFNRCLARGFVFTFAVSIALGEIWNLIALVPVLELQVVAFVAYTSWRALLFACLYVFIGHSFGNRSSGTISALTTIGGCVISGLIWPCARLSKALAGTLAPMNMFSLLLSLPLILMTLSLHRHLAMFPSGELRTEIGKGKGPAERLLPEGSLVLKARQLTISGIGGAMLPATAEAYHEACLKLTTLKDRLVVKEGQLLRNTVMGMLQGLAYLHTRSPVVVHRDIKSANVLLDLDFNVKLADFGCSKRCQEDLTTTFRATGSLLWMAPEVVLGTTGFGRKADIWSFGCTVLEAMTAEPPWGRGAIDGAPAAMRKIGYSEETPPIPEGTSAALLCLLQSSLQRSADLRPTATELLSCEYFMPTVKDRRRHHESRVAWT